MAYITKRGSSYSVRYTYQDEHGKSLQCSFIGFESKADVRK